MTIHFSVDEAVEPFGVGVATLRPADANSIAERELRERLVIEDRLVELASTFVGLSADRFDEGIEQTLFQLGSMPGVVRVTVFRLDGSALFLPPVGGQSFLLDSPGTVRFDLDDGPFLPRLAALDEVYIDIDPDDDHERPEVRKVAAEGCDRSSRSRSPRTAASPGSSRSARSSRAASAARRTSPCSGPPPAC